MLYRPAKSLYRRLRRDGPPGTLPRDVAIWAYRLILGREPESEDAITTATLFESTEALVRAFIASAEFKARGSAGAHMMHPHAAPLDVEWQVDAATMEGLLAWVAQTWERLGKERPHWSVLAGPEFLPENLTTEQQQAFYDGGAYDLRMLLATLARVGREPAQFDVLFEFGCGLGRVTSHLCKKFKRVVACDISSHHLALAQQALDARGIANVELRQATATDFGMSEPYDLWFNRLVLQHNSPPLIAAILDRAFAMLRPQGLAVFQVPVYLEGYRFKLDEYRRIRDTFGPFEMHALPQPAILAIARRADCTLLEVREDDSAGDPWTSQVFTFEKT